MKRVQAFAGAGMVGTKSGIRNWLSPEAWKCLAFFAVGVLITYWYTMDTYTWWSIQHRFKQLIGYPEPQALGAVALPITRIPEMPNQENLDRAKDLYDRDVRYIESIRSHNLQSLDFNMGLYQWQLWASNVMLFLVVCVVAGGLIFSGYQIYQGIKPSNGRTTLKLGIKGAEVSTSIVGIVTLVISMGFTSMFLDKVYKIDTPPAVETPAPHLVDPKLIEAATPPPYSPPPVQPKPLKTVADILMQSGPGIVMPRPVIAPLRPTLGLTPVEPSQE